MPTSPPAFRPLRARAAALRALREGLWVRGFIEVDTPQLVPGPGLEPHIDPLNVDVRLSLHAAVAVRRYLITSPELALKRVVAQGHSRVFQLGHVWRDGEQTTRHSPEFTLLEWYRGPGSLDDMVADTVDLVRAVAAVVGNASDVDVCADPDVVTVFDAFAAHGIDLDAAIDDDVAGRGAAAFVAAAVAAGVALVGDGHAFDDVFFAVMDQLVEPSLSKTRLSIVERWPASMAVLARHCDDDRRYARRFECYAHSRGRCLELCNAFDELRDPVEQRRRFEDDNATRRRLGKPALPLDEAFLSALPSLPDPTAGNALGVDRLLMLLMNTPDIADVMTLPFR